MAGPEEELGKMCKQIADVVKFGVPGPMSLYLGCIPEESEIEIGDFKIRIITFSQEGVSFEKIEK